MKWIPSIGSILASSHYMTLFLTITVFIICFAHASSSPSLNYINSMIAGVTGSANNGALGTLGLAAIEAQLWVHASTTSLGSMIPIELPPSILFYFACFVAGFLGSLIGLKKESRIIDSIIAPIITAGYIVVGVVILSIISSAILGGMQAISGQSATLSIDAVGYIMIFLVTYFCFFIGAFMCAGIKELLAYASKQTETIKAENVQTKKKSR